jgi:hypothetical protein
VKLSSAGVRPTGTTGDGGTTPEPERSFRPAGEAISRRELFVYGSIFGWLPFFRPKHVSLAGARYRIIRNGHSHRRYLLIHGNEETAREVLTRHMETHAGIAYIAENHTRTVPIESGQIDPNRMFSRVGAERNLKSLNPDWPAERLEAALRVLDQGRDRLLRALLPPPGGLLIALHNNTEYSVNDETSNSDATSIREPVNPHAFFLCTDPADYQILVKSGYNAVLQQKAPAQDDGSLSRLAAARGVRYANLEVALGNFSRQEEMLDWLDWVLPEKA